jgi:hypothetical protein
MSKALDKINELLEQKFGDAFTVDIHKGAHGMSTTVNYETDVEARVQPNTITGGVKYNNLTEEEEE